MIARYRTKQGDMVDAVCWHHYDRQAVAVEAVLDANPGLAAHGPVLPADLVITLPDLPALQVDPAVRIWD